MSPVAYLVLGLIAGGALGFLVGWLYRRGQAVALVFNDNAYGNVRRSQVHSYGGRVIGTDLHNPDFVKMAEAFGAQGLRATNPTQIHQGTVMGNSHVAIFSRNATATTGNTRR